MPTYTSNIDVKIIEHYFKAQWDNVSDHRPVLQALMKRGNVERGVSGKALVWNVRVGRYTAEAYAIGQPVLLTEKRQTIQATLPWAFLTCGDAITNEEVQMASGPEALQRRHADLCRNMYSDFESSLDHLVLNSDGSASSSSTVYGLPSFLKFTFSGSAIDGTPHTTATYAGHKIALNGLTGVDDPEPDAWSPKAVSVVATDWGSGQNTWAASGVKAIQRLATRLTFGNKDSEQPDLVIVTASDFTVLKHKLTESQRIVFSAAPSNAPQGLGIKGAMTLDGLEVVFDAAMPAGVAYMLNTRQAWLEVLPKPSIANQGPSLPGKGGSDLFDVRTQEDLRTNGTAVRCNWAGQFRFNPRYHGLIKTA